MSNFFGDLIGRHKEQGTSSSAKAIVEPCPKARYEADTDFANAASVEDPPSISVNSTAEQAFPNNSIPALTPMKRNANPSTPTSVLDPIFDKDSSRPDRVHDEDHSDQKETLTSLLPNRGFSKKLSIPASNNAEKQKPSMPAQKHNDDNYGHHDDRQVADNLDQQIQSILQRLKASEGTYSDAYEASSIDKESRFSSRKEHAKHPLFEQVDNSLKDQTEKSSISSPVDKGTPYPPVMSVPLKTSQEGQLTIPNWLASMQSEINQRWQHLNAEIESAQPVVNVTIGRVEVRALQGAAMSASNSQQKAQKKPSGVMSLSDYLKSRDYEGRA